MTNELTNPCSTVPPSRCSYLSLNKTLIKPFFLGVQIAPILRLKSSKPCQNLSAIVYLLLVPKTKRRKPEIDLLTSTNSQTLYLEPESKRLVDVSKNEVGVIVSSRLATNLPLTLSISASKYIER